MISGIEWVSDLIEWCGGTDIFKDRSKVKTHKEIVKSSEVVDRDPDTGFDVGVVLKLIRLGSRGGWIKFSR